MNKTVTEENKTLNEKGEKKEKKSKLEIAWEVFYIVAMAMMLLFICTVRFVYVSGDSMNDTYVNGDKLVCNMGVNNINRGDVIVTKPLSKAGDKSLIKRVIGLPNDEVAIKDNIVYVNGEKLEEDYIKEEMFTFDIDVKLADDEYFVMGDNRNNSKDSREIGPIKSDEIFGRIVTNWLKPSFGFPILSFLY